MPPEIAYYARLLRYDAWANAESLASLGRREPPGKALRWMGHIVGASALWLARLRQEAPPMPVWPELDLGQCAAGIERLAQDWPRYLDSLAAADLEVPVGYRNSLGEYWTSEVGDILTHVAMHGAYHRAQIAAAVRESGGTPAYTDFIHAVRQRLIQ
jgi:uncharacterized damage-inducible protein DinB